MYGEKLDEACRRLRENDHELKELYFVANQIGDSGTKALADALKSNDVLRTLCLNHDQIGDDGAKALAGSLKINTTLQRLNLSGNHISDDGAQALLQTLEKYNRSLRDLGLYCNGISGSLKSKINALVEANAKQTRHPLPQPLPCWVSPGQRRNPPDIEASELRLDEACRLLGENDCKLTDLNLSENEISCCGAITLAGVLKSNNKLQKLNLSYNRIGDDGTKALAGALKTNVALLTLNLCSNLISCDGAKSLASAIKSNTMLQTLHVGGNKIGIDGAMALADALESNAAIQNLNIGGNNVCCRGAKALAEALERNTTLQQLILGANQIGDDGAKALAGALESNTTLQELNLSRNRIGDDGAQAMLQMLEKHNGSLTDLVLYYNSISDSVRNKISDSLRNKIDSLCMANYEIPRSPKPQPLTRVSPEQQRSPLGNEASEVRLHVDEACRRLSENDSALTDLNLSEKDIGCCGAKALAGVLKSNYKLKKLNLSYNRIGDVGAKALAEALNTNITLDTINLCGNKIGSDGAKALADAIKSNTTLCFLHIGGNKIGYDGAKALSDALKSNNTMRKLNLGANEIGGHGARALAEALGGNTKLQQLILGANQIGDDGTKALSGALEINTTLQELNLSRNQIGDDGAQALLQMLEKHNGSLNCLYLHHNNISTSLKNKIGALVKENREKIHIAEPKTLDRQQRSVTVNDVLVSALQAREKFSKKGLCPNCAETKAHKKKGTCTGLMHKMEPITEKDVNGNYKVYEGYGIKPLCHTLGQSKCELDLNLEKASEPKTTSKLEKASELTEACRRLRENDPELQVLDLRNNQIGADGAEALANALKSNTTLQALYLSFNQIGVDGTKALADALKKNTTLQELELEYNRIGSDGAKALAHALKKNTALQLLDLDNNQIGDYGAQALLQMLEKHNGTLSYLRLDENSISDRFEKQIDALMEANRNNTRNPPPQPLASRVSHPEQHRREQEAAEQLFSDEQEAVPKVRTEVTSPLLAEEKECVVPKEFEWMDAEEYRAAVLAQDQLDEGKTNQDTEFSVSSKVTYGRDIETYYQPRQEQRPHEEEHRRMPLQMATLNQPGHDTIDETSTAVVTCVSTEAEELSTVVMDDNMEEVMSLLDAGVDANAADDYGAKPLHYACSIGSEDLVKVLLDRGASVHVIDEHGKTPLHEACTNGKTQIAELLLDRGANVNAVDNDGKTPLYEASENAQRVTAQLLIKRCADVLARTNMGRTPLMVANFHGNATIASMLETAQDKVCQQYEEQLRISASCGDFEEVGRLLATGVKVNAKNKSGSVALHYAAREGHKMISRLLLAEGADINAENDAGCTALHIACMHGQEAVARELVAKCADVCITNSKGKTPLMCAKEKGHDSIVSFLRDATNNVKREKYDIVSETNQQSSKSQHFSTNPLYEEIQYTDTKKLTTRAELDIEICKLEKVVAAANGTYNHETFAKAVVAEEQLKKLRPLCHKEEFTPASELRKRIPALILQIDTAPTLREKYSLAKRLRRVTERYQGEIRAKHSLSDEVEIALQQQVKETDASKGQPPLEEICPAERHDCLVVFQSAPLVWFDGVGKRHPLPPPDFQTEKHNLIEAIEEAEALGHGHIDLVFEEATTKRIGTSLATGRSRVLHFSCHGQPEYLGLENKGAMQALSVNQLKGFIAAGRGQLKAVLVSACHSRPAGEAFLAAGVDHVICCKTEASLRDTAAAVFAQHFYTALACGYHLSAAFELARQNVLVSPEVEESEVEIGKFLLLPEKPDGDSYHDVPIFKPSRRRSASFAKKAIVRQSNIPPPPEMFLGRELVIYQILEELARSRCVFVEGPQGVGKSSVTKATLKYICDRSHTFSISKCCWVPSVHNMREEVSLELNHLYKTCKRTVGEDADLESGDFKDHLGKLATSLYDERALVAVDARGLDPKTGLKHLNSMLLEIIRETCFTRVIVICPPGQINFTGTSYDIARVSVEPLDLRSSALLFGNCCKFLQNRHFKQLYSSEMLANILEPHWILGAMPNNKSVSTADVFSLIGGGNPASVRKAAAEMTAANYNMLIQKGCRQLEESIALISAHLHGNETTCSSDDQSEQFRDALDELSGLRGVLPSLATLEAQHAKLTHAGGDHAS